MSLKQTSFLKIAFAVVIGAVLGAILVSLLPKTESTNKQAQQKQPLYWVAPMDANYRRDKPGKSPMGMDLIPVYEDTGTQDSMEKGAVKIAPHVINNLGVRTAPVEFKHLNSQIATVGYVQYDQNQLVHIHPRVEGWVEKLYIKATGDPVEQGQPLYTLYAPELVNAQEELLIALKRNNASLISAAEDRLTALKLSPEFIQTLKTTRQVQQNITFYARQTGVVAGLEIREGFYVKPGTTLMSIAKLDQVWVEAEVFEQDAARIKAGLPVTMTLDYLPGRQWAGTVDYVYPVLNSKTRTLRARLKFENTDLLLKPNMFAKVTIAAAKPKKTLVVPKDAVIRTGQQDRVVVALGDGQFKSIEVTLGQADANELEILQGLTEKDSVVVSAQFLIDSESSKSSDFKRLNAKSKPQTSGDHQMDMAMDKKSDVSSATVNGTINHLDLKQRILNISRGPIKKWNRAAATMDFVVADKVNIEPFKAGDQVTFTFEVGADFVITEIFHQADDQQSGEVDHADHSNHSEHTQGH